MGWIIYNSKGEPLVTQEQHDHTAADASGPMTNDEHDGYSEYEQIAIPSAPAANEGRLFLPALTGNDSIVTGDVGIDETGIYHRRPDGLMVKLSDDFPYNTKMRHVYSAVAPYGDPDEPPFENSWVNLSNYYGVASFIKDFLGCVWVQGLVMNGTVPQVIFTMPEGYWNTGGNIRWAALSNGAFGMIDLRTNGLVYVSLGNNNYVSLFRVAFPETNRITWHNVGGGGEPAFENSWVNNAAGWDVAAFAKDAIGRVWIKGLVKDGAAGTVFTLPAGYRPAADIHMVSTSHNNVIAKLQVLSDGSVDITLLGAGTNTWANIDIVFTADGEGSAPWREVGAGGEPAFLNSWVNFGGAWDTAAFYKDAAGIVHIKGLIKSGVIGTTAFTLPVGYRPKQAHLFPALSNDAIGRLEVREEGIVVLQAGSNNWFSIHAAFVAEQ